MAELIPGETPDDHIAYLQGEILRIRNILTKQDQFKSIEAQGSSGAKTEFVDPEKLRDEMKGYIAELQTYSLSRR